MCGEGKPFDICKTKAIIRCQFMVIELLSLVLNAVKVLQGFRPQKQHVDELSADLRKLFGELAPLYDLLQQAKTIHDFLEAISEDLRLVADPPDGGRQSRPDIAKSLCRRIKGNPRSLLMPEVSIATPEEVQASGFSPIIKDSLKELMSACPAAINSLSLLNKDLADFCRLVDNRNFGREFDAAATLASDHSSETKFLSDRIIFHLVPILTELFHQMKAALK